MTGQTEIAKFKLTLNILLNLKSYNFIYPFTQFPTLAACHMTNVYFIDQNALVLCQENSKNEVTS